MDTTFSEENNRLKILTRNTRTLVREIETSREETVIEFVQQINPEEILFSLMPEFNILFEDIVSDAIKGNREYSRKKEYKDNLINSVQDNLFDILFPYLVSKQPITSSYHNFELYAGGLDQFWEGVQYARDVIAEESDSLRKLSRAQKAAYWRNVVWKSNMYDATINLRFERWGEKSAPYWYFLEYGNIEHDYAFPKFSGTAFLWIFLIDAKRRFETEILRVKEALSSEEEEFAESEYLSVVEGVVNKFLQNPYDYETGSILTTYFDATRSKYYQLYVTKKGRLGRRLQR